MNELCEPVLVGIDWADKVHAVCVHDPLADTFKQYELKQKADLLTNWGLEMSQQYPGREIFVCLEQSRGPLVLALSSMPGITCYPINPKSLARYREARFPSRSKSDPADARLLCDYLRHHREDLRALSPLDPISERLARLTEHRRKLVGERTRQVNRLRAELKVYFPQILEWFNDITSSVVWQFLLKWPTLADLKRSRTQTVLKFLHAHHVRRGLLLKELPTLVKEATALHTNDVIMETSALLATSLCHMLLSIQNAIDQYEQRIDATVDAHPDVWLVSDLPGVGRQLKARLLAAFGSDRSRYPNALVLTQLAGIAPVCESSGNREWTHMRWAASRFMRQTFHEFALHSLATSAWAKSYYKTARARGKTHHVAVRALAFKWIRVLYACWSSHSPYCEQMYIRRLHDAGSPYAKAT